MQIQAKTGGILYDHGGKPGSIYPDLEPGKEFWNRVWVPSSDYRLLVTCKLVGAISVFVAYLRLLCDSCLKS